MGLTSARISAPAMADPTREEKRLMPSALYPRTGLQYVRIGLLNRRLPSGKVVRVTQPNVYRHADERVTWDEQVYLQWDATSPVVVTK